MVRPVLDRADRLRENPFPQGPRKLAGAERLHRIRIGDYRMIYAVDPEQHRIVIHDVRHRRDAYRHL